MHGLHNFPDGLHSRGKTFWCTLAGLLTFISPIPTVNQCENVSTFFSWELQALPAVRYAMHYFER